MSTPFLAYPAERFTRSHDAVIRVYDQASNVNRALKFCLFCSPYGNDKVTRAL